MKKLLLICLLSAAVLTVSGCYDAENTAAGLRGEQAAEESAADGMLTLTFGEQAVTFIVADNPLTRELMARIPTSAEFEDYENRLKFTRLGAPLASALNEVQPGYDPSGGDIAYDTANDTIVVFYCDAEYSDDLIYLGTAESGSEWIPVMEDNVEIT